MYFISHVGGHKYSANVMVYRRSGSTFASPNGVLENGNENGALDEDGNKDRGGADAGVDGGQQNGEGEEEEGFGEGSQCIWLARVRPEDCEGIIRQTVLKGKVVKPNQQLRGGFDRGRGLVSW